MLQFLMFLVVNYNLSLNGLHDVLINQINHN